MYRYSEKSKDTIIFEMGHKPWNMTITRFITPLQIGADGSQYDITTLKDNTGENISNLNRIYGEVTGIYWIWKNSLLNGHKYVGQTTYGRSFMIDDDFDLNAVFEKHNYEIIVGSNKHYLDNDDVYNNYKTWHNHEDLDIVIAIIKEKYPEYVADLAKTLRSNFLYTSNGFIMKNEDYKKYCEFLFDILFEWQKRTGVFSVEDMYARNSECFDRGCFSKNWGTDEKVNCLNYEVRAPGFLSERLFTLYVNHNFSRVFTIPYKSIE